MMVRKPKSREQIIYEHHERLRVRKARLSGIHRGREQRYRAPYWIAARVVTGLERFASDALRSRHGAEVFYPRIRVGPEKLKALFPGYVFIKIVGGAWMHLQYSPGLVEIVKYMGDAARIDDREMRQLFKQQGKDGYIDLAPPQVEPKDGDQLFILGGVFKSWIASYIGRSSDKLYRARFDFMGKPTEIAMRRSEFMILGRS